MVKQAPYYLAIMAALLSAGAALSGPLTCESTKAWRLEVGGMVERAPDFYGLAATSDLRIDPDAGTFSAGTDPVPGMVLRSRPDPATGADLVYSTADGAMLFRARILDGGLPFLLIDTYEIYVGTCHE